MASNVIKSYLKSMGGWVSFSVLLSVIVMQTSRNLSDVWLAHWVTEQTVPTNYSSETNVTSFYLTVYSSIAAANSVVTLIRSFIFAYAGIKAAKFIHNKLLQRVFAVSINQP